LEICVYVAACHRLPLQVRVDLVQIERFWLDAHIELDLAVVLL
jgi:hypothetical protein